MQHSCSEQGTRASWDPPRCLSAHSGQGAPSTSGCQTLGFCCLPDSTVTAPLVWDRPGGARSPKTLLQVCRAWDLRVHHIPGCLFLATSESRCRLTALPAPRGHPGSAPLEGTRGHRPAPPFLGAHRDSRGFPKNTGQQSSPHSGLQLPPPIPSPRPLPHCEQRPSPPRGPAVSWMPPRRSWDSQGRFGTQDRRDRTWETTPTTGAAGLEEPHPLTHPRPSGPGTASSCRGPSQLQSEG